MSQADNRNSSAAKRARTDGSRREDDWTCPSCGNVNFSFRTTCNMRNCTQPRPADHNTKSVAKPLQPLHSFSSSAPYVGPVAPSSMYMSVPPYGSSMFNGSSMPPYEAPFSGGSAYPYNYGSRFSGGSPYRPLHMSAPSPYTGGSMIGNGGMYAIPPMMDRYGVGLPVGPPPMGPRPGFFPDEKSQKKDATRDNDWTCPKCGNINFSFRTFCNMRKCNTPKPGSQTTKSDKGSNQKMPEGSWKCEKCNNINYPFRMKCNRQNCGADKPSDEEKSTSPQVDENEQVCCAKHLLHVFCNCFMHSFSVYGLGGIFPRSVFRISCLVADPANDTEFVLITSCRKIERDRIIMAKKVFSCSCSLFNWLKFFLSFSFLFPIKLSAFLSCCSCYFFS